MYRVMIVDDENWVVENLRKEIRWEELGFEVKGWAFDGKEAFEKQDEVNPDVIFTDIRMPVMTGLDLIKQTRLKNSKIEFVVVSAFAEFAYVQKALNYGVTAYCLKPVDDDEIACILKRLKNTLDIKKRETEKAEIKQAELMLPICDHEPICSIRQEKLDCIRTFESKDDCHPLVSEIIEDIEQNIFCDISLQDISKKFFISPSYLCRIFKKSTGKSLTTYITELRMAYACKILKHSSMQINKISKKVGYNNYFYFARTFKQIYNMTPSQFRENN